jgi:hypothetical protein
MERFKLDFSRSQVELPGLTLRPVELLRFESRPIGQLLYEGDGGVIALSVMAEPGGEPEREAELRAGLNTLYWASGNYRFLLASTAPREAMEKIADMIERRFAPRRKDAHPGCGASSARPAQPVHYCDQCRDHHSGR